jgi:hypothetical protein
MDDLLELAGLGNTVHRIKENVEHISSMITRGDELLNEASVQVGRGRDLLDQNQRLVQRMPRTLTIVEVAAVAVVSCVILLTIKLLFFYFAP